MTSYFVKRNEINAGDYVEVDAGFTCIPMNSVREVLASDDGLYINCAHGRHYLHGQLGSNDEYVGLTLHSRMLHRSITNS